MSESNDVLTGVSGLKLRRLLLPVIRLFLLRKKKQEERTKARADPDAVRQALRAEKIFRAFPDSELSWLAERATERVFAAGETVVFLDEPSNVTGVFAVISGGVSSVNRTGEVSSTVSGPCVLDVGRQLTDTPSNHQWRARGWLTCVHITSNEFMSSFMRCSAEAIGTIRAEYLPQRQRFFASQFPQTTLLMRQSWAFASLPDLIFESLIDRLVAESFFPHDDIATRGDQTRGVLFLRRGTFAIDSEEVSMHHTGHAVLLESNALYRERCSMTCRAVSMVDGWLLPVSAIEQLPRPILSTVRLVAASLRQAWLLTHRGEYESAVVNSLRAVPYLEDAPTELIGELLRGGIPQIFRAQTAIASVSTSCNAFIVVVRGVAKEQHRAPRLPARSFTSGSSFGETCIAEQHRWLVTVCAVNTVEAWIIPRSHMIETLRLAKALQSAQLMAETTLQGLAKQYEVPVHRTNRDGVDISLEHDVELLGQFDLHPALVDFSKGRTKDVTVVQLVTTMPTQRHKRYSVVTSSLQSPSKIFRRPKRSSESLHVHASTRLDRTKPSAEEEPDSTSLLPLLDPALVPTSPSLDELLYVPPPTRTRHQCPATFLAVSAAEHIGEQAPWLFVLLDRQPIVEGFLEGSLPGPLDTVVTDTVGELQLLDVDTEITPVLKAQSQAAANRPVAYSPRHTYEPLPTAPTPLWQQATPPATFDATVHDILEAGLQSRDLELDGDSIDERDFLEEGWSETGL